MLGNDRISIIIPTYNYGHRIKKTLESLRDQNDAYIEILVMDDGSEDQTAEVIHNFKIENPALNLSYYYHTNRGAGATRNIGLQKATGEFLFFLDSDDFLLPNALANFRKTIKLHPEAYMITAGHLSCDESTQMIRKHPFKINLTISHEQNFLLYLRKKISILSSATIYRKKALESIRFSESVKNSEDVNLFFQVLATQTCVSFPDPVVMHIKHAGSLRNQFTFQQQAGLVIADLIFDEKILPKKYFKYRTEYLSSRLLSLSRMSYHHKAFQSVVDYYESAIRTFPKHILKWSYFKKYFCARLKLAVGS